MQLLAAALLACGCVSLAEVADWPAAESYVATASCSQSTNAQNCANVRADWAVTYSNAIAGRPESQRIVSFCLSTGCDGAVVENRMHGCAWRHVIVASGDAASSSKDRAEMLRYCSLEQLDATSRQAAQDQAKNWLILLGITAENKLQVEKRAGNPARLESTISVR